MVKDAPSEISKRLLNGDHAETIDVEVSGEDARPVLDGLLRMDAKDLSAFMSWLEKASPEERHKMAETMSRLTEDEQKKLLALSPEQARALFASTSDTQQPAAPKSEGAVRSLTSALRGLNERFEKRETSS